MTSSFPLPRRVLVVDDSFIMRRLVKEIVESDPDLAVCASAENGKVALAMVRRHKPDVVLLDIEMPEMSGLETLRRLGLRSPSKVIILSSLVADEDAAERIEALRLGAFATVGKPSGAVSLDIRQHRGSEIVAAVRRAADLPPLAGEESEPNAVAGEAAALPATAAGSAALIDFLDSGILAFDARGILSATNPAAARLLGPIAPGLRLDAIFTDFNATIAARIWDAMKAETADRFETDLATPEGEWIPLRIGIGPIPRQDGRPAGVVVVLDDVSRERRMKALLDKTLSASVADRMIAAPEASLAGETKDVTVLFADLRDFTKLSEALGAAGMVTLLNDYFSFMADVIQSHAGVIDKYIGDAIMAVFGAPASQGDDADRAVAAARDMVRALALFNEERIRDGQIPIRIGIGLATGPVIAGIVGAADRFNFTVIGNAVNLAARLEAQTKRYGVDILACGDTVARLTRADPGRWIDLVQVVGQERPTELHALDTRIGGAPSAPFSEAFALYREGAFARAEAAFAALPGHDAAAARLATRCAALRDAPPEVWTGVWRLTDK